MELEQTWEALHVLGNRVNGLSGALDAYLNRTAYFSALENRTALNDISYAQLTQIWTQFVQPRNNYAHSPFYVDYDTNSARSLLERIASISGYAGWIYPESHKMQWLRDVPDYRIPFHPEIAIQNPQDYLEQICLI